MSDPPGKRLLYLSLIGLAAIVPLAINPQYGGIFALQSILFVAVFIYSDRRRNQRRQGFPVILKDAGEETTKPSQK